MLTRLLVGAVLLAQAAAPTSTTASVYLTNYLENTVAAVNGDTVTAQTQTLDLKGVETDPIATALARNGSTLYVLCAGNTPPDKHYYITEINAATNTYTGRVRLGFQPKQFLVAPDGKQAYVRDHARITIVNLNTGANTYFTNLSPTDEALSPDGKTLYVSQISGQLLVISTANDKLVATIPTGINSGTDSVAVSADGTQVYLQSYQNLQVLDATTHAITTTVALPGSSTYGGFYRHLLTMTPDGCELYAYTTGRGTYSVIDLATNTVINTLTPPQALTEIAFGSGGTSGYAVSSGSGYVINAATGAITASMALGSGPHALAVNSDGSTAALTSQGTNTMSVIDLASNTATATVPVGGRPTAVSLTGSGKAFAANGNDSTVSVVDTGTGSLITTVPSGFSEPSAIAVSPDGHTLYLGGWGSDLRVVDSASMTTDGLVTGVGNDPRAITFSPDGAHAYVADDALTVSVVDTATRQVTTVPVGGNPADVVVSPDGADAYLTNTNGTVTVLDTHTNTVTRTIAVGGFLGNAVLTPNGATLYVDTGTGIAIVDTATGAVTGKLTQRNPFAVSPDGTRLYTYADDQVQEISTATNAVTATIPGPAQDEIGGAAISRDGTQLFVLFTESLETIDTATGTVTATANLGDAYRWSGLASA